MQQSLTMPLARYFLFVGGTLLAMLFAINAYFPTPVVSGATAAPVLDPGRPVVRIHSAQKLPERIVMDTSLPTIVPPPVTVAEAPVKASPMDALARMPSAEVKSAELKTAELKKPEPKAPPKRRVAKRQVHQPMLAYAQVPPR